jgi:hypothetical protein
MKEIPLGNGLNAKALFIYDLRLTIYDFSFLPRSPREICKTVISLGKSAKSAVFDYFFVVLGALRGE